MSKVIVHRHAVKYLNRLPKETKDRIKEILRELEENPIAHSNAKHMAVCKTLVPKQLMDRYDSRWGRYRMRLQPGEVEKNKEILTEAVREAFEAVGGS